MGNPWIYNKAVVTNVVDGDTIDCEVDLGFHMRATIRFRLCFGDKRYLDCPEMGTPEGVAAKRFTTVNLLGKNITLNAYKADSFGRWLAEVILEDGSNFGDVLELNGHLKV